MRVCYLIAHQMYFLAPAARSTLFRSLLGKYALVHMQPRPPRYTSPFKTHLMAVPEQLHDALCSFNTVDCTLSSTMCVFAHPQDAVYLLMEDAAGHRLVERAAIAVFHEQANFVRASGVWRSVGDGLVS